jgi:transposase
MHNNTPVHTAQIIQDLLEELYIKVMIWPPYLPDLNPIENLWAILKMKIYELHPELEHATNSVDTLYQLIEATKEAWHAINEHILQNLSNTMPHRVQAIIAADGWYTKY